MAPKAFSENEKGLINRRLLEQGYRLFTAHGLKKTNIEEIATAAGISKSSFYAFYPSKEALLMEVMEEAERRLRKELLAVVDQPGPSPRARLLTILKKAFDLFDTLPLLQIINGSDYELIFQRIPHETMQEHLANDMAFFAELTARCHAAGIPVRMPAEKIIGLLYPLVLAYLHKNDLNLRAFPGSLDVLLELIAAYSLGEIEISSFSLPGLPERNER